MRAPEAIYAKMAEGVRMWALGDRVSRRTRRPEIRNNDWSHVKDPIPVRILKRAEHPISRKLLSSNAVKVLYRLHRAGYLAYLVGGGVRDLLLGGAPKDFDVGTNARPEEIRRLFRNSRIIGRRFRLVHVFFHGEIIEVSTFRSSSEAPEGPENLEEQKLVEREDEVAAEESRGLAFHEDNHYGTPREDAFRRDLTINSLFYDISDFSIIDWVGGLEDLERRLIRTVGPARERFEEDPVRMMRALEYRVRLDFRLDEEVEEALHHSHDRIREAAPARLTYELMEALRSGHAAEIWKHWRDYGLLDSAFPEIVADEEEDTTRVLGAIDRAIGRGWKVSDATVLATLFLPGFLRLLEEMAPGGSRLDNAEFLRRLKAGIQPSMDRMMVSNHNAHLIYQGLFALTKMRRAPSSGRQILKMIRQDSFGTTWDLYRIAAAEKLFDDSVRSSWEQAIRRARDGSDPLPGKKSSAGSRRRRRPRRRSGGSEEGA